MAWGENCHNMNPRLPQCYADVLTPGPLHQWSPSDMQVIYNFKCGHPWLIVQHENSIKKYLTIYKNLDI